MPHFAVIGYPDEEPMGQILRNLIHAGANPQSWGDRKPPYHFFKKGSNLLFTKDGDLLADEEYADDWDNVVCIQNYEEKLSKEVLDEIRDHSLWIYAKFENDYDDPEYNFHRNTLMKSFPKKNKNL